jgi:hypothetical protein
MDIKNQEPNIDESDVKPTLSTDLTELEKRTEKEEETAEKTQEYLDKKKAELEKRRQEAENKKKEARKEIKEIKKELKADSSEGSDNDSDADHKDDATKEPAQPIDEDAQFEAFKTRLKAEQEKESLQKSVDNLIQEYPEASVESLQKIETLAADLKQHYPNLTPEELVAKATYLELGEKAQDEDQNERVDASAPPSGGSNPKSKSLSFKFKVKSSHKEVLKKMGISEEDYLKDISKRFALGEDISSKYGVIKIK